MSEILEKYKGKKIIVALPGDSFSGDFLINLILLNNFLNSCGINISYANMRGSCIHKLRNECGGADVLNGLFQTPYSTCGAHYDYILWIDSDIRFTNQNFVDLIEMDKDVCSGWYLQRDRRPACGFLMKQEDKYKKKPPFLLYDKNHIYTFLNDTEIEKRPEPYIIDWTGMGWMLIKKGVMEKIKYPWFDAKNVRVAKLENGADLYDSLSEDLSFELSLKEAGFDIWMNPKIRLGHEKVMVI